MRKVLAIALLGLLCFSDTVSAMSTWELAEKSVFQVRYIKADGNPTGGTAFCVPGSDSRLLTAYHVIDLDPNDIPLVDSNGKPHKAKVVKIDKDKDIAEIEVADKACKGNKLKWAKRIPKVEGRVTAIGHGGLLGPSLVAGQISGKQGLVEEVPYTIPAQLGLLGGHSGCPVFDSKGRVVGMAVGYFEAVGRLDFFVPVDELRKALDNDS